MGKMAEFVEEKYRGRVKDEMYELQIRVAHEADAQLRLIGILFDDTRMAMENTSQDATIGYRRRTLVRTLFAHIGATLSIMRQTAVRWHLLGAIKLSDEDLQFLSDEFAILGSVFGKHLKPRQLPLKDSLKFTLRIYGSTPGKSVVDVDTNSPGWNSFCKAINIRNNLVHPKTEDHLLLPEAEAVQVMDAWQWFQDISSRAFMASGED